MGHDSRNSEIVIEKRDGIADAQMPRLRHDIVSYRFVRRLKRSASQEEESLT